MQFGEFRLYSFEFRPRICVKTHGRTVFFGYGLGCDTDFLNYIKSFIVL